VQVTGKGARRVESFAFGVIGSLRFAVICCKRKGFSIGLAANSARTFIPGCFVDMSTFGTLIVKGARTFLKCTSSAYGDFAPSRYKLPVNKSDQEYRRKTNEYDKPHALGKIKNYK
jgi:hypothetical protein